MVEKIVKETFKPDPDDGDAKKDDKVIEERLIDNTPDQEIPLKGALVNPDVIRKRKTKKSTND